MYYSPVELLFAVSVMYRISKTVVSFLALEIVITKRLHSVLYFGSSSVYQHLVQEMD